MPLHQPRRDGSKKFDDSYFHRDFNVVRTAGLERDPTDNAIAAAARVRSVFARHQEERKLEQQVRKIEADERYRHAFHDIIMDREKKALCQQLDELCVQDRERKKVLVQTADTGVLPKDRGLKEALLARFFERQFTQLDSDILYSRIAEDSEEATLNNDDHEKQSGAWAYRSTSPLREIPVPRQNRRQ